MSRIFPYDGLRDMLMLLRKLDAIHPVPYDTYGHSFIARISRMYGRKL